ncbi:MAG TPA: hypothetical protein VM557_04045 [Thermoanaerobaculia bacterium]|nr:hypothetical protein [Thermoanaerobaculia bacterium]
MNQRPLVSRKTVFLFLAILATSAFGSRVEFVTKVEGERIQGSEVCFFPGISTNQLLRDFSSGDVRCLAADQVIELPSGGWTFFARHEKGLISNAPGHVTTVDSRDAVQRVDVPLFPAETVKRSGIPGAELKAGERLVVFFPHTEETPSYGRPVLPGSEEIKVPAGADWYLVRLSVGGPVWLSERTPHRVRAEGRTGLFDVLVALDLRKGVSDPPVVHLLMPDGTRVAPVRQPLHTLPPDLVIFKNVPRRKGTYEVEVAPAGWTSEPIRFQVPAGDLFVWPGRSTTVGELRIEVPDHILLRAVAPEECLQGPPNRKVSIAGSSRTMTDDALAAVLSCPPSGECTVVAGVPLQAPTTSLTIPEGEWTLNVTLPYRLRPWTERVVVKAGEITVSQLVATLPTMRGMVIRDGIPVVARVEFPGGVALSDHSGIFTATLNSYEKFALAPVEVHRCDEDEDYVLFPDDDDLEARWLNLDLSDSAIHVDVTDASNDEPVAGARTRMLGPIGDPERPRARYDKDGPTTDDKGIAVFENIQPPDDSEICATHPEFDRACSEVGPGDRAVSIAMKRLPSVRGRIMTSVPVKAGGLFLVSPGVAMLTGHSGVEADGSFVLRRTPEPTDYAVFFSATHPLFVFIPADYANLEIPFPAIPSRTLHVSSTTPGPLTLSIGGRLVPKSAFDRHQNFRGHLPYAGDAPLLVPDILPTAPVLVHRGPAVSPPGLRPGDIFLMPEWVRTLPAAAPDEAGRVQLP